MANRTLLLGRTFFGRFFESDLMPAGLPQVQLLIWSLAFLAAPNLLFPVSFALHYSAADARGESLVVPILLHRMLFITMTMTAIGLVALVIWDGVFPDRRDARILTALPVPHHVLISARLLALGALCGIFLLGVNAAPTLIYGSTVGAFGGAVSAFRGLVAHFVATSAAGVFVFTTLVGLQGIVLNIGGRRAADRLSLAMQIGFILILLQMIFFLPRMGTLLLRGLDQDWVRWLPSAWFLGLYDVVGGKPAPGTAHLATIAIGATAVSSTMAVGLFVGTHARLAQRALETPVIEGRFQIVARTIGGLMRWLGGRGIGKAAFDFTLKTLGRARSHRLLMAMYVGAALAFVASALVPVLMRSGIAGLHEPTIELMSAPFFLSFFSLVGMRVAMAIPVEPKANWAVRISEPMNRPTAIDGVRKAMFVVGVVPSVLLAGGGGLLLWGTSLAVLLAPVAAMMGWLLTELLLVRFPKLPFTCTYFPGTSKVGTLWPLYLIFFGNYTLTTAAFVWTMSRRFNLRAFVIFTAIVCGVAVVLTIRRNVTLRRLEGLRFQEEDPEAIFGGFQLSESLAATPEESRQLH
jgi:hypothetical protein